MKTKITPNLSLLQTLTLFAVLGISRCLAIESIQPFGYYFVSVGPGFSTIANQLYHGSNTLNEILPVVADGTELYKFNSLTRTYDVDVFVDGLGWSVDLVMEPGDGFWIHSPVTQNLTFVGEVPSGAPGIRPLQGFHLRSSRMLDATTSEEALGFPPQVGDQIIFYDGTYEYLPSPPDGASSVHHFGPLGWDTQPHFGVGKSFYVGLSSNTTTNINTNTPPRIGYIGDETVHAGTLVALKVLAWDVENNRLTYAFGPNAPAAAHIDPITGSFSLQTTPADQGKVYRLDIRVTDNGVPPLSASLSFTVTVDAPLRLLSCTRSGDHVSLEWNAIPGKEYAIKSKSSLTDPNWYHEAVVTADSSLQHHDLLIAEPIPNVFYGVTCMPEPACPCVGMTFEAARPIGPVKFTVNACVAPRPAEACSVDVEIPLALNGKLNCGIGSKGCEGDVIITLSSADWQFIDATTGASIGGPLATAGGWNNPFKVHANCDDPNDPNDQPQNWGEKVVYSVNVPTQGRGTAGLQDLTNRKRVKAGTIVLRGSLKFEVCWTCALTKECRTITIAVDGRADNAVANRQGGFDFGDSDFDGDGWDGDGVNAGANKDTKKADKDPYDPNKNDPDK